MMHFASSTFLVSAAVLLSAGCFAEASPSPADSVKQLDMVEAVMKKITADPQLTPAQLKSAKSVVDDVHLVISQVEAKDSNLTQEVKAQKVAGAVKELQNLKSMWQQVGGADTKLHNATQNQTAMQLKMTKLQEKIAEKKSELAKKKVELARSEKLVKLASLEKELEEKKEMLSHLLDEKKQKESAEKAQDQEQIKNSEMVATLTAMAKSMAAAAAAKKHNISKHVSFLAGTPSASVQQLDAVESALHMIVSDTHLTAAQQKSAKKVVDDVQRVISEVEAKNSTLTQEAKTKKVAGAVQELETLQSDWQHVAQNKSAIPLKMQALKEQLAKKKAELMKDEKMIKLMKLQKELEEKKLELSHLLAQKSQKESDAKHNAEDQMKETEMVTKLTAMAKGLAAASQHKNSTKSTQSATSAVPAPLKKILTDLQKRESALQASMASMDKAEKASEADLDRAMTPLPTNGADDAKKASQAQMMLKTLRKQEQHKYRKARAAKMADLNDLKQSIHSIETGDLVSLNKVMTRMQRQMKALNAKSGDFLH